MPFVEEGWWFWWINVTQWKEHGPTFPLLQYSVPASHEIVEKICNYESGKPVQKWRLSCICWIWIIVFIRRPAKFMEVEIPTFMSGKRKFLIKRMYLRLKAVWLGFKADVGMQPALVRTGWMYYFASGPDSWFAHATGGHNKGKSWHGVKISIMFCGLLN